MNKFLLFGTIFGFLVSPAFAARADDSSQSFSQQRAQADLPFIPNSICGPCDPEKGNSPYNNCSRMDQRFTGLSNDGQSVGNGSSRFPSNNHY